MWPFRLINNVVKRAGIKNAYVNLWLGQLLWGTIQGFLLFWVVDLVCQRIGLLQMERSKLKDHDEEQPENAGKSFDTPTERSLDNEDNENGEE